MRPVSSFYYWWLSCGEHTSVFCKMNSGLRRRLKKQCIKNISALLREELITLLEEEVGKGKRIWTRKWLRDRSVTGASALLLQQLRLEDPSEYRMALRVTTENFDELLSLVHSKIQRNDTLMRDALPAKIKLEVTLSFLATGMSYRSLSHFYRVSKPSISVFIPEVCRAIYEALKQFIKVPNAEEWKNIETGFKTRWNFPLCYGSIDGKHVPIKAPPSSGSLYFNYKKTSSIVLLAVADHDYCFSYIDVGACGSASDGGVFKNSSIYRKLENNLLPNNGVIVGDAAFPLKTYLMKPYPGVNLSTEEKVFNYRLSRARRIIENAFGILVSRFRVLEKPIQTNLEAVDAIVCACCALHNWLRKTTTSYITATCVDVEDEEGNFLPGSWRSQIHALQSIANQGSNHSPRIAREKRELYKNMFMNEGSVPWQLRSIH
ncbi:protein ALP1-like [Leguminivora glycinivorella]|uniref:protein ALP1-like n=1 Tax=Leguminivora glycinivorella TaxID=1035111 RepID=UPI00200C928C|nr:protein ALP1-like [Leguminivora glycinivorella]